jgi:hypothetical protein
VVGEGVRETNLHFKESHFFSFLAFAASASSAAFSRADLAWTPVKRSKVEEWSPTRLIVPS